MSDSKNDIFIKIHGLEALPGERVSIDIELVTLQGDRTAPMQSLELSMNGKTHRLATLEDGRLRTELIFPVQQNKRQYLHARMVECPGVECTTEIVPPGYEDSFPISSTGSKPGKLSIKDILGGNCSIKRDQTATIPGGFHEITCDIHVERCGKLTIEPGAALEFSQDSGIVCEGILEAVGTAKDPILFSARQARWRNILLYGRYTGGSHICYCTIEHGTGRTLKIDDTRKIFVPVIDEENIVDYIGGGILLLYTYNAEIVIEHVTVRENIVKSKGGGIYLGDSSPIIRFSEIVQNESSGRGGGIFITGAGSVDTRLQGIHFAGNKAHHDGGGIFLDGVSPVLIDLDIRYNEAHFGAALYHLDVNPGQLRITKCTIEENVSFDAPGDTEGVCGDWTGEEES